MFWFESFDCKCAIRFCAKNVKGGQVGMWAPAHWGLGEIDGLLVLPGKASNLLTDHQLLMCEPSQEKWFSQLYKPYWLRWVVIFMKHFLSVMTS